MMNQLVKDESVFANAYFDELFKQEKQNKRRSQPVDNHEGPINEDGATKHEHVKDTNGFNQSFYKSILVRAKLLLIRKDQKDKTKSEHSNIEKPTLGIPVKCKSKIDNECKVPSISRSESIRHANSSQAGKSYAKIVTSEILEVKCSPDRPLPGRPGVLSQAERLLCGLDCDEVSAGIILASGKTVKNIEYMRHLRVTHIVNTAARDVWLPEEKMSNLGVELFQFHVDDVPTANISPYFRSAAQFLAQALQPGGLVVVNCLVGFSRSATVVTAALMINNQWTAHTALTKLRRSRPVKPNMGFMVQLVTLETQLREEGLQLQ